ncbi:MAG: type restriction-modification system methyltransferase subunit [Phycisphaerales bacterium]|nr:type restriction-modification system methyltransferase subunit [Phycisphaerales bacterium]
MPPRFALGRLVATPAALSALAKAKTSSLPLVARHAAGDWGDLDDHDKAANDDALLSGARLLSAYTLENRTKVWVITEAVGDDGQRASTCVLLPEDY